MSKPPNLTTPDECWRAILRARGLFGQGDISEEDFWIEVSDIADIYEQLLDAATPHHPKCGCLKCSGRL